MFHIAWHLPLAPQQAGHGLPGKEGWQGTLITGRLWAESMLYVRIPGQDLSEFLESSGIRTSQGITT